MAVLTNLDTERKKRTHKKLLKRLIALIVVCGLTIGVIYSKDFFTGISISELLQEAFGTVGKTGSFPVSLVGETGSTILNMGGSVAVLTDSDVQIFSHAGRKSGGMQNGFANPILKVSGNRGILYSRGAKTIKSLGKGGELLKNEVEDLILTAEISGNGSVAVATQAQRRAAKVDVYDGDWKSLFTWYSAENQVLSLALSPDAQKLAAGTLTAREGVILSTVILFSIPEKKELAKAEFPDTLIAALKYTSDGIQAIGDNKTVFIDDTGAVKGSYSYEDKTVSMYANTGDSTALVLGAYKRDRQVTIVSLSEQCNVNFSFVLQEHVRDIYTDGTDTYILTDDNLYDYNKEGQCVKSVKNQNGGNAVMASGENIYLLMPHKIVKLS